jgi:hypothetical protein
MVKRMTPLLLLPHPARKAFVVAISAENRFPLFPKMLSARLVFD